MQWGNTTESNTYNSIIKISNVTDKTFDFAITTDYNNDLEKSQDITGTTSILGTANITSTGVAEYYKNNVHILFELDKAKNILKFQTEGYQNLGLYHAEYTEKAQ